MPVANADAAAALNEIADRLDQGKDLDKLPGLGLGPELAGKTRAIVTTGRCVLVRTMHRAARLPGPAAAAQPAQPDQPAPISPEIY